MKFVDKSKVDMKKIDEFVEALAGVEIASKKIVSFLREFQLPDVNVNENAVVSLQVKFNRLEGSFSSAKSRGKSALRNIRKALL